MKLWLNSFQNWLRLCRTRYCLWPWWQKFSEILSWTRYWNVAICVNIHCISLSQVVMKKALGETQTLRAGCSNVEPKKFALLQTPFPGCRMAKI